MHFLALHAGAEGNSWLASGTEILAFFHQGKNHEKKKYDLGKQCGKNHFETKEINDSKQDD